METKNIQEKLHEVINSGDSRLLKILYSVAKGYADDNYTLAGKPMTERILKNRSQAAKKRISSGQFVSHEEIEKEMKVW
jgi:hypothetical protein